MVTNHYSTTLKTPGENMTSSLDVIVTPGDLVYIRKQLTQAPTALSPFFESRDIETSQQSPSPGLIMPDGRIRAAFIPVFQALTKVQSRGYLSYVGDRASFETSVFYPAANSGSPVALMQSQVGYRMQSPPEIAKWLTTIGQLMGESTLKDIEFEVDLSPHEAWVFFTVIDIIRRQMMKNLSENIDSETYVITLEDLSENTSQDNSQWLGAFFAKAEGLPSLSDSEILAAVKSLTQKRLVNFYDDSILPGVDSIALAVALLTLEASVQLQAATLDNRFGTVGITVTAVKGRGNTCLSWSGSGGSVSILSVSAAQLMIIIGSFLEAPSAQFTDSPFPKAGQRKAAPTSRQQDQSAYIPQVGKPVKKKKKTLIFIMIVLGLLFIFACLVILGGYIFWEYLL
jgi:hypothetical protein